MALIAKVIVDVPVMQTNKPYDYLVPSEFSENIVKGMRVVIPFGRGSRKIQGFVVDLLEVSTVDERVKEISSLMDLNPVLDEEMLKLGQEMADQSYSFQINCFQTMLPSVMRAKYEKYIKVIETDSNKLPEKYRQRDEYIPWEEIEENHDLSLFMKLKKEGIVDVHYAVKDKRTNKKIRKLKKILPHNKLQLEKEEISNRAKKQKELIEILIHSSQELIDYKEIQAQGISAAVLKEGENKGWIQTVYIEEYRDPYKDVTFDDFNAHKLNQEQENAYNQIAQTITDEEHRVFLLKGVTGSGKTEVYLQSIAKVLEKGQGALMLVPEISLTPQMVSRFKGRFGDQVAVLHSGLSDGEKYDEWRRIENKEANVVVGARSSIFAPLNHVGIIIIDEEHENTYKQEENPRYHARDIAIWRGKYHNSPVILGSATPSLESRARASKNVYQLLELNHRVNQKPLPKAEVIDMKLEAEKGNHSIFSETLKEAMQDRLDKNEQIVLLLNRRGHSSFMLCRDCGFVKQCPNCDISLTMHKNARQMKCHYCGHQEQIPTQCPQCHNSRIRFFGTGTQKVEDELRVLYPDAGIIRMDVDTTSKKGSHEALLDQFGKKEAQILLGTQMISKGLDFPEVTLVGVLNADTSMALPDFRSSEKTFQLLTQVAGRSGRADLDGEVIIQTYNPEHYAIQLAKEHDYNQFYLKEMYLRHLSNYPPYYFMIQVSISHEKEIVAAKKMAEVTQFIRKNLSNDAIVLGPAPKSVARTKNRYHYQTIVKYKNEPNLHQKLQELMQKTQGDQRSGLYMSIDPNPMQMF